MGARNERIAYEFAAAFNAHDVEACVALAASDCEVVALRSELEGAFVGEDGVRRWIADYVEAVPDVQLTIEQATEVEPGRLLVLGRQRGHSVTANAPFDAPLAAVLELEEGLLKRLTAYPTHERARAAAGVEG